ncbi:MAG: hypothetical protein PHI63_02280 [Patescibacteria group bacterium]|nr:hypothetical protein [Patescibacteria group bacterium]
MADKYRVTPKEFKGTIERLSKRTFRTPFVPKRAEKEVKTTIRKIGIGSAYTQSTPKIKFLRAIGDLQARGVFKQAKDLAPKRIYEDIQEERATAANAGSNVSLGLNRLPAEGLTTREFVDYCRRSGVDVTGIMGKLSLTPGPKAPRPGAEPHITKTQMSEILRIARREGKIAHGNIGKSIAQMKEQQHRYMIEGLDDEQRQMLHRYLAAVASGEMSREDLPPGIERTAGRYTQGGALHAANQKPPTTSTRRAGQQEDLELKTHATTASALGRRPTPKGPKSSSQRYGKSVSHRPELANLSFDID